MRRARGSGCVSLRAQAAPDALRVPRRPQREAAEAETAAADAAAGGVPRRADSAQQLPPALRRRYRVYFKPLVKAEVAKLRDVRAADIGKIVTVKVRACARRTAHARFWCRGPRAPSTVRSSHPRAH